MHLSGLSFESDWENTFTGSFETLRSVATAHNTHWHARDQPTHGLICGRVLHSNPRGDYARDGLI